MMWSAGVKGAGFRHVRMLLVTSATLCVVAGFQPDNPINSWNPNYYDSLFRDSMYKRYNEEMPRFKWSPRWFRSGLAGYKRAFDLASDLDCVPLGDSCSDQLTCCDDLVCQVATQGHRCVINAQPHVHSGVGSKDGGMIVGGGPSPILGYNYRAGPPPFFPRKMF